MALSSEGPVDTPPGDDDLAAAVRLARRDDLDMALLWQNPQMRGDVVGSLERYVRGESTSAGATGRRARRAERGRRFQSRLLSQYLQRYFVRNESVGFFGPVAWGRFVEGDGVSVRPGPRLTAQRTVMFEEWAIHALADRLAQPVLIRAQLPPALVPGAALAGHTLIRADADPAKLSQDEAAVMALIDGRRTVAEIGRALGTGPQALTVTRGLAERGLIHWGFDIPLDMRPEEALLGQLRALPSSPATGAAIAGVEELLAARDLVCAAESPAELSSALEAAEACFERLAGRPARRSRQEAATGFTLLVPADRRAVDVTVGTGVLRELAAPLGLVLDSARWFCWGIGQAAEQRLAADYQELTGMYGPDRVPLAALVGRAQAWLWSADSCASVRNELTQRWARVLAPEPGAARVHYRSAELAEAVAAEFAAPSPQWFSGRHHSPDVMIAAGDAAAVARGEFQAVLGELHAGMITADSESLLCCAADPHAAVRGPSEAALADGPPRFVPLHSRTPNGPTAFDYPPPDSFSPHYSYLSFAPRSGARPTPVPPLPAGEAFVREGDAGLEVRLPDGRVLPLLTVLGEYLIFQTGAGFGVLPRAAHTPRVTVDRLVIARERWCLPTREFRPESGMTPAELHRRLARVCAEYELPRYCFWRSAAHPKPVFLDTRSRMLSQVLVETLASDRAGEELTFTEMTPGPSELWLPDAQGQRYTSELRLTMAESAG